MDPRGPAARPSGSSCPGPRAPRVGRAGLERARVHGLRRPRLAAGASAPFARRRTRPRASPRRRAAGRSRCRDDRSARRSRRARVKERGRWAHEGGEGSLSRPLPSSTVPYRLLPSSCLMLLAININNTETKVGLFRGDSLEAHWRLTTAPSRTPDEWAAALTSYLAQEGRSTQEVRAAV